LNKRDVLLLLKQRFRLQYQLDQDRYLNFHELLIAYDKKYTTVRTDKYISKKKFIERAKESTDIDVFQKLLKLEPNHILSNSIGQTVRKAVINGNFDLVNYILSVSGKLYDSDIYDGYCVTGNYEMIISPQFKDVGKLCYVSPGVCSDYRIVTHILSVSDYTDSIHKFLLGILENGNITILNMFLRDHEEKLLKGPKLKKVLSYLNSPSIPCIQSMENWIIKHVPNYHEKFMSNICQKSIQYGYTDIFMYLKSYLDIFQLLKLHHYKERKITVDLLCRYLATPQIIDYFLTLSAELSTLISEFDFFYLRTGILSSAGNIPILYKHGLLNKWFSKSRSPLGDDFGNAYCPAKRSLFKAFLQVARNEKIKEHYIGPYLDFMLEMAARLDVDCISILWDEFYDDLSYDSLESFCKIDWFFYKSTQEYVKNEIEPFYYQKESTDESTD
jgi:hypothetical protein